MGVLSWAVAVSAAGTVKLAQSRVAIANRPAVENMRLAAKFFRDKGVQSRPIQCHGIDLVTDHPHVNSENVVCEEFEKVLKPGMIMMPALSARS